MSRVREEFRAVDLESEECLAQMRQDTVLSNRIAGVKFVLVILSARGMVYDLESLRQKILLSYPDAAVFFQTAVSRPLGLNSPSRVDLLIDLSAPGQRQGFTYPRKLRKMARFAVGRNVGYFRKKIYDRIFDELDPKAQVPTELLQRERFVQKKVLNLAGVVVFQTGEVPPDRGKTIALELPGLKKI